MKRACDLTSRIASAGPGPSVPRAAGRPRRLVRASSRGLRAGSLAWLLAGLLGAALATPTAQAQQVDDIFSDLGTAQAVDEEAEAEAATQDLAQDEGLIRGQVFDAESGSPVKGVTVIVVWPPPADGSVARQEVATTDFDGAYEMRDVPAGRYELNFVKSGYRTSKITNFEVLPREINRADFPMQPLAVSDGGAVLDLEAFVVEASAVEEIMADLELRLDSDQLLNVLTAEDLSRFAAGDVADALRRVSGVNVVEGQFAIIRGLEDRYSSTLYNGAPVPSPDPDRQSVQLDLFPSEIVSNLQVAKTFSPGTPSNSAGGNIDIITHDYPDEWTFKWKGGTGFNENALVDGFERYDRGSPIGIRGDDRDIVESETGGFLGGRGTIAGREFRLKTVFNTEIDFQTAEGTQEGREPVRAVTESVFLGFDPFPIPVFDTIITESASLETGELPLTDGLTQFMQSDREEQTTYFGSVGLDLDQAANHQLNFSAFSTSKENETVQLRNNCLLPGLDYRALAIEQLNSGGGGLAGQLIDGDNPQGGDVGVATGGSFCAGLIRQFADPGETDDGEGGLVYTNIFQSGSFLRERDLTLYQLNGDHQTDLLPGLRVRWAINTANTTQFEDSLTARFFFEPDDVPLTEAELPDGLENGPLDDSQLGSGVFRNTGGIFSSVNDISEDQRFGRVDLEYERNFAEMVTAKVVTGGWWEQATRDVDSEYLQTVSEFGADSEFNFDDTSLPELGRSLRNRLSPGGFATSTNDSKRKIFGWNINGKLTFLEKLDISGGIRRENIRITSNNAPFTGGLDPDSNTPRIFPSRYLFCDRIDNPDRALESIFPPGGAPVSGFVFNDELIAFPVSFTEEGFVDVFGPEGVQACVNGDIDEKKTLPSASFNFRPIEGLSIRGAWSQTVARPSFRELGYYVSLEPGSDDQIVGNPQLQLSEVESWDARIEYTWGGFGDLLAASGFVKRIEKPIEQIVLRDAIIFDTTDTAIFRTFFNNPSDAELFGIEVEGRKNLGFLGFHPWLEYLTVGGNYTYINAEVDRTPAELMRSRAFFGAAEGTSSEFPELEQTRRLFGQPEWIVNADISFDHPDWGTKWTLAFFAISDVLDAAGTAGVNSDGSLTDFTLDRYVDSFHTLDFVFSQTFNFNRFLPGEMRLPGDWTFKFSAKNLTDSRREIVYDTEQLAEEVEERSFRVGRDYSFSITYSLTF